MPQRGPVFWSDHHLCFCVLNKSDCGSGVWGTYMCKHTLYKWKSRGHKRCLIHRDMSFFPAPSAMATQDNTKHIPPPKRNHGTCSPTVEPVLSFVWVVCRQKSYSLNHLVILLCPIYLHSHEICLQIIFYEKQKEEQSFFSYLLLQPPEARLLLSEWDRLPHLIFISLPWNQNTKRKLSIATSKQIVYSQPTLSHSHGLLSARVGCLKKGAWGERDWVWRERKESSQGKS